VNINKKFEYNLKSRLVCLLNCQISKSHGQNLEGGDSIGPQACLVIYVTGLVAEDE
jgi:hypothetical protein